MPYCTKCGAPLKEADEFCPVCGASAAKVTREEYTVSSSNLVDRVGELLHEGNVTRVIVKDMIKESSCLRFLLLWEC